ncbi:MAG: hypothetical protein HYT87_17395 [Nitrospirae bacterium]|nr:hypothetical protein [Nitrospirota bacterium]
MIRLWSGATRGPAGSTVSGASPARRALLRGGFGLILLAGCDLLAWLLLAVSARFGVVYRPISDFRLLEEDRRAVVRLLADGTTYLVHSPSLGWSIRPQAATPDGMYRANSQGIRAGREYTARPPHGLTRISAYGDSFVHGDEVGFDDTWEAELMRLDPRLEALNFGVMGFGSDQAFLRYREERTRFQSQVVLIGYMSENIQRTVNVFRAFYTPGYGMPFTKPRFVLDPSGLKLLENPLPTRADYRAMLESPGPTLRRLSKDDGWFKWMPHEGKWDGLAVVRLGKTALFWYRRVLAPDAILTPEGVYRRGSDAFELTRAILSAFYAEVEIHGEFPVIVLFPSPADVRRYRKTGKARYAPLADDLQKMKRRVIDTLPALAGLTPDPLTPDPGGGAVNVHYSAAQNKAVARKILEEMSHSWPDALKP